MSRAGPPRRLRGRPRPRRSPAAWAADPTGSAASGRPTRVCSRMLDPFSSGQEVAAFNNEVARLSHGALRIRVVDGRDDGPDYEAAAIRAMRRRPGRPRDCRRAAPGTSSARQRLRALHAPLLIDSYELQERVLDERARRVRCSRSCRRWAWWGSASCPGPFVGRSARPTRLATPRDFRGLTIGTQQSRVADATMRALGARPRGSLPRYRAWPGSTASSAKRLNRVRPP